MSLWRRVTTYVLSGWLALLPIQYAVAVSCEVILGKTLQGVRSGATFKMGNSATIYDVPYSDSQPHPFAFDFAVLDGTPKNKSCPDAGFNSSERCEISSTLGTRGNRVSVKTVGSNKPSVDSNSNETHYLGVPDYLLPYFADAQTGNQYYSVNLGSNSAVVFWGGVDAQTNSKGYIEYQIQTLLTNSNTDVYMPPGDIYIGGGITLSGGEVHILGDQRPDGWDDFIAELDTVSVLELIIGIVEFLLGVDAGTDVDRASLIREALSRGLSLDLTDTASMEAYRNFLLFDDEPAPDSLADFLWPVDFPSDTTRIHANGDILIQNNNSGINRNTRSPVENLVIHSNSLVQLINGELRGSLIQDNRDGAARSLIMQNGNSYFEGLASVEMTFDMSGGNFYHNTQVLNADFSDICDGGSTDIDIELEITREVALTCEVVDVTLRVRSGGSIYDSFEGGIRVETSTSDGVWTTDGYGLNGSLNDLGNGNIQYNFVDADNGEITLGFSHPSLGLVSMQASDESEDVFSNTDAIEFVPEALTVSFNPEQYPVANEPFELIINAIKVSDDDPSECVSDINYNGAKNIALSMRYIDNDLASKEELTVDEVAVPEQSSGDELTVQLTFDAGESEPLTKVNYKDVGGLTVIARDQDFSEDYPDETPLTGEGSTTVIPSVVEFVDVRSIIQGSDCGATNLGGTAGDSDKGFTAAGDNFEALVSGLIANCTASGSSCDPDAVSCAAPNFSASVALSASLDTPLAANGGVLGDLSGDDIDSADFSLGSAVAEALAYDEVGSINLQLAVTDWAGLSGVNYQHELVVGRFYPAYLERTVDAVRDLPSYSAACVVGDYSYLSDPNQSLSFELLAYASNGQLTENYDNDTLGYVNTADAPDYLLYDGDSELSERLVGLPDALEWQHGVVSISNNEFAVARAATPDGQFMAPQLGLALIGGDGETFADDEQDYDCGGATGCSEDAIDLLQEPLAELRYGRLVATDGYSPESLDLHVPLRVEYWYDPSSLVSGDEYFTINRDDSCTPVSFAEMSFSPDKTASDEITIGAGTSTVSLTADQSVYDQSAVMAEGRLWVRYTAPNNTGSATHYVGEGGDSLPVTSWPEWLRYDWDGDGTDDPAVSGVATFGRTRGSDRVISRREL